ncbi:MAG TPA: hypothetical protein VJ302_18400, partial [Blastocatellia bacterium]|nr:hypothetical protein [Blastocatellia bacterium]
VYKDDNMGYCAGCDVADSTAKAMVYMAGFAAEREFSGFILGPRGTDYANAKNLISTPESLLPQITAHLRANRAGIFALAHELDRAQTVSGPRAITLLRGGGQSSRLPTPGSEASPVQSSRHQTASPPSAGGQWDGTPEGCQRLGSTYDAQQQSCHYGLGNPNTPSMHDDQEDPSGWTMQCSNCRPNDPVMEAHRAQGGKIGGAYARRQQ